MIMRRKNEHVFETPFVDGCNIQNALRLNTTRWIVILVFSYTLTIIPPDDEFNANRENLFLLICITFGTSV